MQPEAQQTTQPAVTTNNTTTPPVDPADQYRRRRSSALGVTVSLLALSLVVLSVGLISATRTDNVAVAGYYPGITLSFGSFLGIVGIHLVENRRPMLVASIIFISFGVIASFLCAIVDGIIASEFIDIRPVHDGLCYYYSSGSGYGLDSYYTEVTCHSFTRPCKLKLKSDTCYCCHLYNCDDYHTQYYEFTGVSSCWDAVHLHRLLWASVVLNVLCMFLGIITAAIIGAYKDMQKPTPPIPAPSPAPPPHILYNPTQHMLSHAGYITSGQALPAYPNYPMSMQLNSNYPAPATPQMLPDGGISSTTGPSEDNQPSSQGPIQGGPQGAQTQELGSFMLTPNAPALYGPAFSAFEKPPPYAC